MKKTFLFLVASLLLCVSCEKTPINQWKNLYDFTRADIIGHYEANPDESVYEPLPTPGVVFYDNAVVDITAVSENQFSMHLFIPDMLNRFFTGALDTTSHYSGFILRNYNEEVFVTTYTNSQNQVRLDGYLKHYHYNSDGVLTDSDFYGFDVIKQE